MLAFDLNYSVAAELLKCFSAQNWHLRIAVRAEGFSTLTPADIKQLGDAGAEIRYMTPSQIPDLFPGVKRVYLFNDLGFPEEYTSEVEAILQAAKINGVEFIMKSSLLGCDNWNRLTGLQHEKFYHSSPP